jgi:hypothetical protein
VLPNEFFQNDELSVDFIINFFFQNLACFSSFFASANSSTDLPNKLLSAPLVWVVGAVSVHPFKRSTMALTRFCMEADVMPGSLRRLSRQPGSRPGGLVFRPTGFFTFFFPGAATKRSWNRFPTRREGFCTPGTGCAFTASTDVVPIPSLGIAQEVRPLTSSSAS